MKAYIVKGMFEMGWNKNQRFETEVAAGTKEEAAEKTYSTIGSRHKVERRLIRIETVDEIQPDRIQSPVVKHMVGGGQ